MSLPPRFRPGFLLVVVALAASIMLPAGTSYASGSKVPFTDEYADGTLTLCNRDYQPITSGSILTAPFVWRAVSSSAAPSGYGRAYLLVYQPIQFEDPSNWTGNQLTDDAIFSKPAHPMAQATNADPPLLYTVHSLPPHWEGLYELRLYYTQPNEAAVQSPYPIAVIQVSGDSWKLLTPETASCTAGTAISAETLTLPRSEIDTPQSIVVDPNPAHGPAPSSSGSAHPTTTLPGRPAVVAPTKIAATTTTVAPSGSSGGKLASATGTGNSGGGSGGALLWSLLALLVVAGGTGAWVMIRRRRSTARSPA